MNIGAAIKQARLKAGLTQRALAESTGVTLCWVERIENRGSNPSPDLLERIAHALGVTRRVLRMRANKLS